MKKRTLVLSISAGVIFIAFFIVSWAAWQSRNDLKLLREEVDGYRSQLDTMDVSVPSTGESAGIAAPGLKETDRMRLRHLGLTDPESELRRSLMASPEIIPYEGVLGGTMAFYQEEEIHILSHSWVLAYFEDGHIAGRALLEFDVFPGPEIRWSVIATEEL